MLSLNRQLNKQGNWTRWEIVWERQGIWKSFGLSFCCVPYTMSYLLHQTSKDEGHSCTFCGRPANLEHILSLCRSSLVEHFGGNMTKFELSWQVGVEQARKKLKQLFKGP